MKIWFGSFESMHFDFEAFGNSEAEVRASLQRAVIAHCHLHHLNRDIFEARYPADEWRVREIEVGAAYIDRERIDQ